MAHGPYEPVMAEQLSLGRPAMRRNDLKFCSTVGTEAWLGEGSGVGHWSRRVIDVLMLAKLVENSDVEETVLSCELGLQGLERGSCGDEGCRGF